MVVFANSIIQYFIIAINYGFNISATKDVATNRYNRDQLNVIASSVLLIKFIIFLVGLCIIIGICFLSENLAAHRVLILVTYTVCLSEVIFPVWFFQGVEDMKFITYLNVIAKILFTVLIFVFVKTKEDYLLVPIYNAIGATVGGVIALIIVAKKYGVKFSKTNPMRLWEQLKKSFPFFLSRISAVITIETNVLIIASKVGFSYVAYYDLAKKIVNILVIPINVLNQAVFPSVAVSKNMQLVKKCIKLAVAYGLLAYITIVVFSNELIALLAGQVMLPAKYFVWILCISVPLFGIHYFLGNTVLVVKGFSNVFNKSVVFSMLFYTFMIVMLFVFKIFNVYAIAIVVILSNLFDLFYRWYFVKKFGLFK
jgi:PST family polysaccharide transporter